MTYIAGDFWRICDRCGFQKRSSETFKTWDGLYVCAEDFETRHPQDFVRGRRDRQNVPEPRPEAVISLVGPLTTTVTAESAAGATLLTVETSIRFLAADHIGTTGSDGNSMRLTILSIPDATSIQLTAPLPQSVPAGAVITNYSAISEPDIG